LLFRLQISHGADDTVTGSQTEPSLAFSTSNHLALFGEQMLNRWVNVVLFAEKPTSKQVQQVLIVGGSESARFVTYSVENNQSECFAINIPTHSSADSSDIKVNSVKCSLFNNDSPNFLSALRALHACSPPVAKIAKPCASTFFALAHGYCSLLP
jgi:hypothetical protein